MEQKLLQPRFDENAVREAYRVLGAHLRLQLRVRGRAGPPARRAEAERSARARARNRRRHGAFLAAATRPSLDVTGIDLSPEMLEKPPNGWPSLGLPRKTLLVMDAGRLTFADESFDAAAVMYVMTVVPDPAGGNGGDVARAAARRDGDRRQSFQPRARACVRLWSMASRGFRGGSAGILFFLCTP